MSYNRTFHPPYSSPGPRATAAYGPGVVMVPAPGHPTRPTPSAVVEGCCTSLPGITCSTYLTPLAPLSGYDPADKVATGDVTRWYSGGLSNKEFINTVKAQGAMEALAAAGLPPYAALTKTFGQATSVVSRADATGQQVVQTFDLLPHNKAVPYTGAVAKGSLLGAQTTYGTF